MDDNSKIVVTLSKTRKYGTNTDNILTSVNVQFETPKSDLNLDIRAMNMVLDAQLKSQG